MTFRIDTRLGRTVNPVASALIAETRALLTAPNKPAAVQALLSSYAQLYCSQGPIVARRELAAVGRIAFDSVRDASGLQQLDAALLGHAFSLDFSCPGVSGSNQSSSPPISAYVGRAKHNVLRQVQASEAPSTQRITYVFVNGIWNSRAEGFQSAVALWDVMSRVLRWPLGGTNLRRGIFVWNPNGSVPEGTGGLTVLAAQVLTLLGTANIGPTLTSATLADTMRLELDADRAVVVVAHSQGTVMTTEAYNSAIAPKFFVPQCMGAVAIAPITSARWPTTLAYNQGIVGEVGYARDIVRDIPGGIPQNNPPFRSIATAQATSSNLAVELSRLFGGPAPNLLVDLALHRFVEHYLTDPVAVIEVAKELNNADAAVRAKCGTVKFEVPAVIINNGIQRDVRVSLVDGAGATITGRPFTFVSRDSTIAEVFTYSAGTALTVRALRVGTTYAIAHARPVRDSIRIIVDQLAPPAIEGVYARQTANGVPLPAVTYKTLAFLPVPACPGLTPLHVYTLLSNTITVLSPSSTYFNGRFVGYEYPVEGSAQTRHDIACVDRAGVIQSTFSTETLSGRYPPYITTLIEPPEQSFFVNVHYPQVGSDVLFSRCVIVPEWRGCGDQLALGQKISLETRTMTVYGDTWR